MVLNESVQKPMEINVDSGKAVEGRSVLTTSHYRKLDQRLKR